ncbi:MAG TPA: PIN domain-containing protein [Actinomycetota bacterium]|nr:PIN domain-containing protein [Actinomycetota bacterium]
MLAHESRSWRGAFRAREVSERRTVSRGWLVELVRLLFVVLFAAAGYTLATRLGSTTPSRTVVGVALGSATGFVLGGVLGRQTYAAVRSMERDLRKVPAAEVVAGAGGLIAGLAVAALLSVPIFRLPPLAAWTSVAFMYATLGFVGYRAGRTKHEDLFALIGMKPRTAGTSGKVFVVDTSALIDGRILDLVATGFLAGDVLVHSAVLRELQAIADSSDPKRRGRGRRGLDTVGELKRSPSIDLDLIEEDGVFDVDAALVRLAKERGASLFTTDHNLSKVAQALGVSTPSLNDLAAAFRLPVSVGDEMEVLLVKEGREAGQAVGYLDDGTMVVVESGREAIGSGVPVVVRNVIKTTTGRMVFANLQ